MHHRSRITAQKQAYVLFFNQAFQHFLRIGCTSLIRFFNKFFLRLLKLRGYIL